jgi:hypothetical protein
MIRIETDIERVMLKCRFYPRWWGYVVVIGHEKTWRVGRIIYN